MCSRYVFRRRSRPSSWPPAWLVLLPLLINGSVAFSSQVSVSSQSAAAGSSVILPVALASQGDAVSGIQLDVQYDSSIMTLSATAGDALRGSGKSIFVVSPASNQLRFILVGWNQNVIPDGTLLNLIVNLNATAAAGSYSLTLSNLSRTDSSGQAGSVTGSDGTVIVQASAPAVRLQSAGVLSSASLLSGPVAPGEIVTLLGAGIGPSGAVSAQGGTLVADTSLLFDGVAAPLLYLGPNQINAIVPFGVSGNTTQVQVLYQDQVIGGGFLIDVVPAMPAVFTQDSSGIGPADLLNQDLTLNSPDTPAPKGSVVTFYATGLGQTDPASADGQVTSLSNSKLLLPITVQIGGKNAIVQFAGAAPGLIAGAFQINAVVPADAPSGAAIPILVTVGTATSPAGVTLAIK